MSDLNKNFFAYYDERIKFLGNQDIDRIECLILMCCYLDSLSFYRFGKGSNYSRFRRFVMGYSNYKHIWSRISLPLLQKHFAKTKNQPFVDLMRKLGVNEQSYAIRGYDADIDIISLEKKSAQFVFTPFSDRLKKEMSDYEYTKIFWKQYRNSAIHEARGYTQEAYNLWGERCNPYYVNYHPPEASNTSDVETRIGFPRHFILNTLKDCLKNLKEYIEKHDPHLLRRIE